MRVFIANFGQQNYLWPKCLARPSVATFSEETLWSFWEAQDHKGYVDYALAHIKTVRGEPPVKPVASRWYNLIQTISETSGDLWIHREKSELWWTVTTDALLEVEYAPASSGHLNGSMVYELHKPSVPWSNRDRRGAPLSWDALHPKAKDFLFTEGTLQQLARGNAEFALALVNGDDLSPWHNHAAWQAKVERTRRNPAVTYDARQKAIWRMAYTVRQTVAGANGQQVQRTMKEKTCSLSDDELKTHIAELIADQDGACALTGLTLQYDGEHDDPALLCSLDRIDSNGHYDRGNLQVVCRFVNGWKSDGDDKEFRRMLQLVRGVAVGA